MNKRRDKVKEHFNSVAGFYAEGYSGHTPLAHLYQTRQQRVSELLGSLSEKNILSIGCGIGIDANLVLAQNRPYYAVDISQNMLRECQKLFAQKGQLNLSVADMGNLPFQDSSFDYVLCLGVIEYAEDINRVFREISRALNKGGYLIISMQNKSGIYRWWDVHVYRGSLFNTQKEILRRKRMEKPLEKTYGIKEFRKKLVDNQFEIIDSVFYDFNVFLIPFDKYLPKLSVYTSEKLERLCHSKLGILASGYIIKCINRADGGYQEPWEPRRFFEMHVLED